MFWENFEIGNEISFGAKMWEMREVGIIHLGLVLVWVRVGAAAKWFFVRAICSARQSHKAICSQLTNWPMNNLSNE